MRALFSLRINYTYLSIIITTENIVTIILSSIYCHASEHRHGKIDEFSFHFYRCKLRQLNDRQTIVPASSSEDALSQAVLLFYRAQTNVK